MILVTGGRGRIARATTAQLRSRQVPVRVATRDPGSLEFGDGVEVVAGDLHSRHGWAEALRQVTGVLLYADQRGIAPFLEQAKAAGAPHLVLVSATGVDIDTDDPIARFHREAETAVRDSGLPWTFLRPNGLATNALQWAPEIRAERAVRAPYPGAHSALVHEADIGELAAEVLTGTGHAGRIYTLTGPRSLSQAEQVAHIAAAIGDEVVFEEVTADDYRQTLSQWGDESMVNTLLDHLRKADANPAELSPDFTAVTGKPARSFAQWADDHAEAFR